MNRVLVAVAVVFVLLAGTVLAAPSFIDWNRYRAEIAARVEAAVGRAVTIGEIDFTLLPAPALSVTGVRVANADGAAAPDLMVLDSLDVRVAFGPLLRGDLQFRQVVLQEPVLELEILADGTPNWTLTTSGAEASAAPSTFGDAVRVDRFVVRGGVVSFRDDARGIRERLEDVNAIVGAESLAGPFTAEGGFTVRGLPFTFDFVTGALGAGRPAGVRLNVASAQLGASAGFRGTLVQPDGAWRLEGDLSVDGSDFAAAARAVAEAAGRVPPSLPGLGVGFSAASRTTLAPGEAGFNEIDLRLGEFTGTGAINAAFGAEPRFDATLAVSQLDLDAFLDRSARAEGPFEEGLRRASGAAAFALPTASGSLDFSVDALSVRGRLVRNLVVTAAMEDGALTLSRAHALLPGVSEITAEGAAAAVDGALQFDGTVQARSDNLRELLAWLNLDPEAVPADRLRAASFDGRVRVRPDLVQAYGFELRFDSTIIEGAAAYAFRDRPAFSVDAALDRLNLDAYLPAASAEGAAVALPLAALERFDTDVRLRAGETTMRGQPVNGVVLDFGLVGGVLTAREITVAYLAGARLTVTGIASGFGEGLSGTGTVNLAGADATGLVRFAGIDAGLASERLGRFSFNATVDGDAGALRVDVGTLVAGTSLRLRGTIEGIAETPQLDLAFSADHDNFAEVVEVFGLGVAAAGNDVDRSLRLRGTVQGALEALDLGIAGTLAGAELGAAGTVAWAHDLSYGISFSTSHIDAPLLLRSLGVRYRPDPALGAFALRGHVEGGDGRIALSDLEGLLGPVAFEGGGTWEAGESRPRLTADLVAGVIPLDPFFPVAPAAPPGSAEARADWSGEPVPFGMLAAADLDLVLSAERLSYRALELTSPRLTVRGRNGTVLVAPLRAGLFGGELEVAGTIATDGLPGVELEMSLSGADLAQAPALPWVISPVSGTAAAEADLVSRGESQRELIANLEGAVSFSAEAGALRGLSIAGLAGDIGSLKDVADLASLLQGVVGGGTSRFTSMRGAATIRSGVVSFDTLTADLGPGTIRGNGTVDLPRRRTALELQVGLAGASEMPPFAIELQGSWNEPRVAARSRDLQGYVSRRVAERVREEIAPRIEEALPGVPQPLLDGIGAALGAALGGGAEAPAALSAEPPAEPPAAPEAPAPEAPALEAPAGAASPAQQLRGFLQGLIENAN